MRTQHHFTIEMSAFQARLLQWSQQFEEVLWLDSNSNEHLQKYSDFDAVLAVDAFTCITTSVQDAFDRLEEYQHTTKDWIFGYLTYDLKNDLENLKSSHVDALKFPDLFFFQPKKLFLMKENQVEMHYLKMVDEEIPSDLQEIMSTSMVNNPPNSKSIQIKPRMTKDHYLEKIKIMQGHIQRGDIYEANFCQEFFAESAEIHPLNVYNELNAISKAPFSTFFKDHHRYALSASPERFLKKKESLIISQPIKGTAKRDENGENDQKLKAQLQNSAKERSENIMIVDLVRNDLSHTALKGSVNVEELCKVYSFEQVHQMISTITSKVDRDTSPVTIIKSMFPMGSMTGAPKISAMQIIEELELTKRGLYSGAIGYFDPQGNFDFNVIIRTILYNAKNKYVSYSVGSAITAKSHPIQEYEECLTKAKAMRAVLEK